MTSASSRSEHTSHLTPQFCLNTTALRDFLRLSRATVDDSISASLNALLAPGASPFSPSSTSQRSTTSTLSRGRQNVPADTCTAFRRQVLFPSWRTREQIFDYCDKVADAPEPENVEPRPAGSTPTIDGTAVHVPQISSTNDRGDGLRTSRNYWGKEQVVNERLDPYSARDYSYTRESDTQVLKDVLANERGVERIVRTRTWGVLGERCEGGAPRSWEEEWKSWRRQAGEN